MTENEKKSFIMYKSFRTMLLRLPMEERGLLITAIYEYIYDGTVTVELSSVADMAFCAIKDTLDRDMASYAEKCRINTENGKKGGRPRKYDHMNGISSNGDFSLPKTERFFEKAKKADNDNVNGNDNENDNVNVNVNGDGEENGNGNESAAAEKNAVSDLPHRAEKAKYINMEEEKGEISSFGTLDRRELEAEGVPSYYIDARLDRAAYYAERQKKPLTEVIKEWWRDDSKKNAVAPNTNTPYFSGPPFVGGPKSPPMPRPSSFDTDRFFSEALSRTRSEIESNLLEF